MSATPSVEVKVNIPPRRRSATLGVPLDESHDAKATVNVKTVRLAISTNPGRHYGSTTAVTVPRSHDALTALVALLEAVRDEVKAQEAWAAEDAEERAALKE